MTGNRRVVPPPRDIPLLDDWAAIRSVGSLCLYMATWWRWDGADWQPVDPATAKLLESWPHRAPLEETS